MIIKKIIKKTGIFFDSLVFKSFAKPNIVGRIKYTKKIPDFGASLKGPDIT